MPRDDDSMVKRPSNYLNFKKHQNIKFLYKSLRLINMLFHTKVRMRLIKASKAGKAAFSALPSRPLRPKP